MAMGEKAGMMAGGTLAGAKDQSSLMGAYMKGGTRHFKRGNTLYPQRSNSNESRSRGIPSHNNT